jgi:Co/Zn/Cd efflux system component
MHSHSVERWQHTHVFLGARHGRHERRTWAVVALTAVMMAAEIVGGSLTDRWRSLAHIDACRRAGDRGVAYRFARRHARDPRFSFGTGTAFSSVLLLALIALLVG